MAAADINGGLVTVIKADACEAGHASNVADVMSPDCTVEIRLWTEDEFAAVEADWQDLLARSNADPLFMSWVWQFCWWRHHAKPLESKIAIYAVYTAQGRLVGIAPLHVRRVRHHRLIFGKRIELLGSTFRSGGSAFSEYLDFVVDRKYHRPFLAALKETLCSEVRYSDLVFANVAQNSLAAQFAREHVPAGAYLREIDNLTAHITKLPAAFSEYLKLLTPTVRRKLWNHRSKLSNPEVRLVDIEDIEACLDRLSRYHVHRWGVEASRKLKHPFYLEISRKLAERGLLRMSYLCNDGQPISAMFNVRVGDVEYNIQSGFDHKALPHTSLGYLHLGFALESASESGIKHFNFLAGRGRNRDYKQDFITTEDELVTFQTIKARPLAWLYRCHDRRFLSLVGVYVPYLSSLFGVFECSNVGACVF